MIDGLPLRPTPATLADWDLCVAQAKRIIAERRDIPTIVIALQTLLAMDQEIKLLRSSNEFLRARRFETTAPEDGTDDRS